MNQDSFRSLLSSSGPGSTPRIIAGSGSRGNPLVDVSTKSKQIDASKPAFKPRKVKKASEGKYRDRAAERREGGGNDYAHVESVLEDFERQNASNQDKKAVEEQRKYLGGDGDHSILVKGLDMALLEQNKARTTLDSIEDDETLEKTYLEASATPKKRTRADILSEFKQKRAKPGQTSDQVDHEGAAKSKGDARGLEGTKKEGKFKPIGSFGEREKRIKSGVGSTKDSSERKKKKRKVEVAQQAERKTEVFSTTEILSLASTTSASKANPEPEPEPEPLGDDFDIFTGAGEYEGIDLGNGDDDDEGSVELKSPTEHGGVSLERTSTTRSKGWFVTEDDDIEAPSSSHKSEPQTRFASPGRGPRDDRDDQASDEGEQQPVRLQPLSTSALPSIRDFLAVDEAAEAAEKRRKRKEKKKGSGGGGGGKSMEEKVNRDFRRLQSYTSKKEASGS